MIDTLIYLCVVLLVAIIVFAILKVAATEFGIPASWIKVAGYIIGLIFLIIVLNTLGLLTTPLRR